MPPLTLALRPSNYLAGALLFMHGLALAAIALAELPPWVHALLALPVLISMALVLRGRVLGKPPVLRALPDGSLELDAGGRGEPRRARVHRGSRVYSGLIVLRYRLEGERRRRSLVIAPDCADAQALRQLRVWLRWRAEVSG